MKRISERRIVAALTLLAIGGLLGLISGAAAAPVGESPWVEQTNSKVRLVGGTVEREGSSVPFAGVQLRIAPGWKTYWRNPGDSGVPPAFDWSGSKNLKSAEVLYPAPHRFADAGGTAIGYADEVVFPVRITPEREGEPVELSLNFAYGLCKDLCIPNEAELRAVLRPDLGKGDTALLDAALAQVPRPAAADAPPWIERVTATLDGPAPGLEIEALFPGGASETDLFVSSPDLPLPVPKAQGPLNSGKQRFSVAFMSADEGAAIKGKKLLFTLVSDQGATETTWTAD